MLRSAGLFSHLQCPFTHDSPGCPRPHCQYGHGTPEASGGESGSDREEAAASHPAATPLKEPQVIGKKLQELERINKAIEVVKTEVEEKQKKLLLYQNVTHDIKKSTEPQIDSNSNMSSCPQEDQSYAVILKRTSLTTASGSKRHANSVFTKKYVIDRSCPATDLEYDPLLNFSAGLLGSTAKDGESQSIQKLLMCDEDPEDKVNKKPRSVSPIRLEIKLQESDDDDDVLVIDVPPLQAISKKQRITKFEERTEDMPVYDQIQEHTDNCINSSAEQTNIATEETVNESKDFDVEESASFPVSPKACSVNSVTNNDIMVQTIKSQNHGICLTDLSKTSVGSKLIELNEVALDHKNEFSMNCREDIQELTQMEDVTMPKSDGQTNFLLEEMCIKEKQYFPSNAQNLETVNHITNLPVLDQCVTEVATELTSLTHDPKSQEEILIPETQILTPKDSSSEVTDDSDDDPEISDSDDPMEECLRIFNEFAEKETKKEIMQTCQEDHSEVDLAETKANDSVSGQKKRIAHSSKSDVKSSNSILVPYRGPTPQHMNHARILHVQQQAVQITAAVKSGQAFVASTQKKNTGCVSPAFHNFGQIVCLNLVEVQPVMPSRNQFSGFSQGSSLATTTLRANMPQKRTLQTTPMKIPSRKRSSGVLEIGAKVPHETRQRYVNSFVEEFLKDSSNVQEAFVKAQMEEKAIYDRCGSKNMYLSIAVNSLKKLRDQRNISINSSQQSRSRDNTFGLRRQDEKNELTGINLYNILKEYLLSDEQLQENGYPRPNPEKPGSALLCNVAAKSIVNDALRRVCCRCGKIYSVTLQGKHVRKEECTYHSGKVLRHRVPGGMETRYSCCEAVVGTPGCQVAKVTNTTNKNRSGLICTVEKMRHQIIAVSENGGICTHRMVNFDLHVHDGQKENLDGFLKTFIKLQPSNGNPGVFSLDCEMCYTTHGLELTRVTVVDPSLQIIYETFVKPDNEILDYNTRFSGVTEENLTNITTSIRDVQAIMLNLFSADTILIGHGLENDLVALKLIHDTVVDTAIVFPHRLGLPHKRALRNLMADYLRRIIQDNVGGHDSSEDAAACMELMLWKVKEDGKGRR